MIDVQATIALQMRCPRRNATAPVVEIFGLSHAVLTGKRKDAEVYRARAAGMWAAFESGDSLAQIQRRYHRDWGPVRDAIKWCERTQTEDVHYRRSCEWLLEAYRVDYRRTG